MKKITFSLLFFIASITNAQQSIFNPPDGIFGGLSPNDDGVVGAIGGSVDVSATGGATYTIPIDVPEGIGGIQPNLSVVYNSQSGNGLLGWGWNMTGLSAITRMGQTKFYDDTITFVDFQNDRFALDGQRLMVVNDVPYGENGAEYKTEIDANCKIVSYTCDTTIGPAFFKVWMANGAIAYYGFRRDSRIGLQAVRNVSLWLLDSIVDRNGNYMTYHYVRGNANYFIDYIAYTGNHTNDSTVMPQYKIRFQYDHTRKDKEKYYIGNQTINYPQLLKSIKVYHSQSITLLHQYDFDYEEEMGLDPSQYTYDSQNPSFARLGYFYNRLKTVTYSKDGYHYNPTRIEWGKNDYFLLDNKTVKLENALNLTPTQVFNNTWKFSGDFNGDGLTDVVIIQNSRPKLARFFINKGHRTVTNPYGLQPRDELTLYRLDNSIEVDDNINWLYVADFNGDGLDDLLFTSRKQDHFNKDLVTLNAYVTKINEDNLIFEEKPIYLNMHLIKRKYAESVLVADFLGEGKCQFFIQSFNPSKDGADTECATLYRFENDVFRAYRQPSLLLDGEKFTAADFNGDGVAEIIYSSDESPNCKMVRIVERHIYFNTPTFSITQIRDFGMGLTHWHNLFCGDFNGDGKTDLLTFVIDGNTGDGQWKIYLFKGDCIEFPSYNLTNLIGIGNPGDHSFSLNECNDYKIIEIADMNGDGKSDIVVMPTNNTYRILYAPFRRETEGNGYTIHPADIQEFQTSFSLYPRKRALSLGNFYGTESFSMFGITQIISRTPITNRYAVTNITDGMGNCTDFSFGYLIHNPQRSNIYSANNPGVNFGNNIYHISLPIKAVKSITTSNSFDNTIPRKSTSYHYENILAHRTGRGFLAFSTITVENYVNNSPTGKTVSNYEFTSMGSYCLALPSTISVYDASNNLIRESQNFYRKFISQNDPKRKVFMAKPYRQIVDNYEVLGERSFLRRRITETSYSILYGLQNTFYYRNVLLTNKTRVGTHDQPVESVDECSYQSTSENKYYSDDYSTWIIGRLSSVANKVWSAESYSERKSTTKYEYFANAPHLPRKVSYLPNGSSALGYYDQFEYNAFGSVTEKETRSLIGGLKKKVLYQYNADGRFLESEATVADNGISYDRKYYYHNFYGNLAMTRDCNDFGTFTKNDDRMGITVYTNDFDANGHTIASSRTCSALRWVGESGCENYVEDLPKAVYFTWAQKQGNAETMTFYDAGGRELRTVSWGMTKDTAIYQDTKYDERGRLWRKYDPYFASAEWSTNGFTEFKYDDYDRIIVTTYKDKNNNVLRIVENIYDGLETTTKTYLNTSDMEVTKDKVNIMGWKVEHADFLDNGNPNDYGNAVVVNYGYYADGKLAWTMVNNDASTRISMKYDDAGNRIDLVDPDYGRVSSHYNAFGQLLWTASPKGDITDYKYDDFGRTVMRNETCLAEQSSVTTIWNYSDEEGTKGLLKSIDYHDGEQVINYHYDDLNRVEAMSEKLFGETYYTRYHYDDLSRVRYVEYPSQFVTENVYSPETGLKIGINDLNGNQLWQLNRLNALGQVVEYQTGDGTISTRGYDNMHRLESQVGNNGERKIQDFAYSYDDFSNLASRKDFKFGMGESFTYDKLNRLETICTNGVISKMEYDPHGRILSKQADGREVFTDAKYETIDANGLPKPHAISSATINKEILVESHRIEYTTFDKVRLIEGPVGMAEFAYGYDHQRVGMHTESGGMSSTKIYLSNCEIINDGWGNTTTLTYLSCPTGVFAVVEDGSEGSNIHYIYKDHLGSWTTITDHEGNIEQEQSYDAWGNTRDPFTWSGQLFLKPMFDRGFTGHEYLYGFDLINMNGRMYDPVMSSFLSVDNYVQSPDFSQNYNRYAYCLNNPLKYTDPDGEFWHLVIGAAIGGAFNVLANLKNINGNVGKGFAYFGIGALAGAISAGVGAGLSSAMWGGSFGAGFIGSATARTALSSFQVGTVIGAGSGLTGGFVTCGGNALVNGENISNSIGKGLLGGLIGAFSGALTGGLCGGIDASRHGRDFFSGEILSSQEKLDVIIAANMPELESAGNPDATCTTSRRIVSDEGVPDYGITKPGTMKRVPQYDNSGKVVDFKIVYNDNQIVIRSDQVRKAWNGDKEALETIFHEWRHGVQFHSGEAGELLKANNNNFNLVKDLLEYQAYSFNYNRTHSSIYLDRMLYYGFKRHAFFDSFLIRNGLTPMYH